jgi:hypothetical protein
MEPRLLLPWRNPVWFQYLSHKVGRLAAPYALIAIFCASLLLAGAHPFYLAALVAQVAFFLLAGYGAVLEYRSRVKTTVPVNAGALRAPAREIA